MALVTVQLKEALEPRRKRTTNLLRIKPIKAVVFECYDDNANMGVEIDMVHFIKIL